MPRFGARLPMNLQQFVTTTVAEIIGGIQDAQDELEGGEARLNPRVSNPESLEAVPQAKYEDGTTGLLQNIEFDVEVTVVESSDRDGTFVLQVGGVGRRLGGYESGSASVGASRVRFSVPILFPR
jgi:hypothetical protein